MSARSKRKAAAPQLDSPLPDSAQGPLVRKGNKKAKTALPEESGVEPTANPTPAMSGSGIWLVCLLRGVNIGGKVMKMTALSSLLTSQGLRNVQTYIQSGNVVFNLPNNHAQTLENLSSHLSSLIEEEFGYSVPVMLRQQHELRSVATGNPFLRHEGVNAKSAYVVFLDGKVDAGDAELKLGKLGKAHAALVDAAGVFQDGVDAFHVAETGTEVYVFCPEAGYGKTKINNNAIEKVLGVSATTRNLNTCTKLLDMMGKSN